MTTEDLGFSDKSIAADERLASILALSRGLATGLTRLFQSIQAYGELVTVDVEDRPTAAGHLAAALAAAGKGLNWVEALPVSALEEDHEPVAVRPLLEGAVRRCARMFAGEDRIDAQLACDEVVVSGALFQLQDVFMGMIQRAADVAGPDDNVVVRSELRLLDQNLLALLRSPCQA